MSEIKSIVFNLNLILNMKIKSIGILIAISILSACVSIPKETVTLSQTLGSDLHVLHNSHRNIIEIYYKKIKDDINYFVDDIYAPFVIHYALKSELDRYKKGEPSLYGIIKIAGQEEGKKGSEDALNEMLDFQISARKQIESKRNELLSPIIKQEAEIILTINQAYEHAIYANSTITGYLQSIRKVKETQQEALSIIGLAGADTMVTNDLVKLSELVNQAVEKGKEIDIKSDDAYNQLEAITNKIKQLTNKNK